MAILSVLVAAGAQMAIGMLWYGPLFGKKWMKLADMHAGSPEAVEAKKRARMSYLFSALFSILTSIVLFLFIDSFSASISGALVIALFLWLGFVTTSNSGEYLFNARKKPWALYILHMGYYLVSYLVMAAIIYGFFYLSISRI